RIGVPRGRMIGGSGSLNSMVWFRGRVDDYDAWGLPGWSGNEVVETFAEVEKHISPARLPHPHPLAEAFGKSIPANDPLSPPTPERESSGVFHVNMRRSGRWSAADAFLRPAQQIGRVTVLTDSEVARVTFDGRRASGVVFRNGQSVKARNAVILSAGAIESPMILFRSGIGPAADLRKTGIEVLTDAPGVGANLHDHPGFGLHHAGPGSGYGLVMGQALHWAVSPVTWALFRSGRLASNTVEAGAFFRVSDGDGPPEIQTHFIPFMMGWQGRTITRGEGYFADVCVCRPKSRGRLSLGRDRYDPLIDLGLLSDPSDLDLMVAGVTRLRDILDNAPLGFRRAPERFPGRDVAGEELADLIRARAGTAYHPVGTIRMGGPGAPLAPDLLVRGVESLYVADASVMPSITSANTNAPSMMIGWRAGESVARAETKRMAS
ncbi:MAG: GMC family oxidoreductase, partial [Rhodobacteraceae bacterium]|nr:GMC family oxidoreductase [Paracoccaceae bacterium]